MTDSASSSSASSSTPPQYLIVGQINRPHGIHGEVRVRMMTNYPERLVQLEAVALSRDPEPDSNTVEIWDIERVRLHQGQAIIKFLDCDDRDMAERLRDQYVLILLEDAVPLDKDEYYFFQLVGLQMITDQGVEIGEVTEIIETGANEVYVVRSPQYGELLIPAIESVVKEINIAAKQIIITPIPGLLPD